MWIVDLIRGLARLPHVRRLIELALDEDLGRGDVTTAVTVGKRDTQATAVMNARVAITVAGVDVAAAVFAMVDPRIAIELLAVDGQRLEPGARILVARGPAAEILMAERTALNFVQRLSGVATQARCYADAVGGTAARVVDTRKTTPGYRALEKAAVTRARRDAPHPLRIECEVTSTAELEQALAAGVDVVLLDNMTPDEVRDAAARAHARKVLVEVSGGITLATIRAYAEAGADLISVGALTHSAPAVDIGLDFA